MIRWLLILIALAFAAPAAAKPGVTVTLSRADGGDWLVDYRFAVRSRVWFFQRSNLDLDGKPWRQQGWTVETPGVKLERIGHFDALTGDAPLQHVRIRMRPFAHPLQSDYTPVLAFSDGGLAFYTDHFLITPQPSREAVAALPADPNTVTFIQPHETLIFNDPGHRLLLRGEALSGTARFDLGGPDSFIYSGDAPVIETPSFAGVIDAGLPEWVRTELDQFTPQVMALYNRRLGPSSGDKPMALIAWQGAEQPGRSLGGSVLDKMLVMQISGQQVQTRSPAVLGQLHWFIAHESAHFWMGQTVRYSRDADGWILEGSADLLSVRATSSLVSDFDAPAFLQDAMDTCLKLQGPGKPLATAIERGENKAFYACGALLMLSAEAAMRRGDPTADIMSFIRGLIDANRTDGVVTMDDWLTAFRQVGGSAESVAEIRAFIDRGVADPKAFWMRLFSTTGVAFAPEGEGLKLL